MRNPSDLPGGGSPRIPRITIGRPSRGRVIVSAIIGTLLVLVLSARGLSSFFVNVLWFDSVGRSDVFWGTLRAKTELAVVFSLGLALFLWANLLIADRLAPITLPDTPEDRTVMKIREATAKSRSKLRIAIALLVGLMLGLPASSQWQEWLMFRNHQSFGKADPLFDADIGFHVFRLPFAQFVVSWTFGALVLSAIVVTAFHFVNGSIRPQDRTQRVSPQAKVHLSLLIAGMMVLRAVAYFLSRFELTTSTRGVVRGALYTDVNAQLPALNLMILVSLTVTAILLWNVRQRGWRLPVIAVGLWVVVAVVAGTLYPAIIQRFVVQPNVSTREIEFIQRNIEATKSAMGIDEVERVETTFSDIDTDDVVADQAALRDIRQLDPVQMRDRFTLDEGRASFYRIVDLDVDRYAIDGRTQQVLVATRELNTAGIPNRTWVSRHLIYTHGCGVVAAPASRVTDDGRPSYIDLEVTRPQIYFGDGLDGYAVVKTSQREQACPGVGESTFTGRAGISFDGVLRRLSLAVNFGEFNLFGSNLITDSSELLLVRDVRDRVGKIAPFLRFDDDPYPVVVDGEIKWVIDAFTTTNRYPYAESADTSQLGGASGLNVPFNYVRNSVKAVVDAYSGEVTLYRTDEADPIAAMWAAAFPDLFADRDDVPAALSAHFRYPEDLFRVQSNLFGRYQFDDATLFFNRDAAWSVSQAPPLEPEGASQVVPGGITASTVAGLDVIDAGASNVLRFSPYYSIFHAPGSQSSSGTFSMVRPFVPFSSDDSRKELRSLMVVSSDPKSYGKMTVYDVTSPLPAGPATVAAEFESDPEISATITPLDLRGSRVTYGDLQMVPIGKGIVYLRPMFVMPNAADAKQVFVRKILAHYNGESVIGDNLRDALAKIFPGFAVDLGDRVGGGTGVSPTTTVPSGGSGSPTTTVAPPSAGASPSELLAAAQRLFDEADAALAETPPDFATYQAKLAEARELVARALAAVGE